MSIIVEAPTEDTIKFAHSLEKEYTNLELCGENEGFFIKVEDIS